MTNQLTAIAKDILNNPAPKRINPICKDIKPEKLIAAKKSKPIRIKLVTRIINKTHAQIDINITRKRKSYGHKQT